MVAITQSRVSRFSIHAKQLMLAANCRGKAVDHGASTSVLVDLIRKKVVLSAAFINMKLTFHEMKD